MRKSMEESSRGSRTFAGPRKDYTVVKASAGYLVVDKVADRDGAETLVDVECLVFSDCRISLDIDGAAGQAYRLYRVVFDREPDIGGVTSLVNALDDWVDDLDSAMTLHMAAGLFIKSEEFLNRYGACQSDIEFVTALYAIVLHRPPDPVGMHDWVARLESRALTRADVLIALIESGESRAKTVGATQHGIALQLRTAAAAS